MSWQQFRAGWSRGLLSFFYGFMVAAIIILAALWSSADKDMGARLTQNAIAIGGYASRLLGTAPTQDELVGSFAMFFGVPLLAGLFYAAINWRAIGEAFGYIEVPPVPPPPATLSEWVAHVRRDLRNFGVPLARGVILGAAIVSGAALVGIIPVNGWSTFIAWAALGVLAGGYLSVRPTMIKLGPPLGRAADDLADAAIMGFLFGGGIAFVVVTAWNAVVHASYNASDGAFAAITVGLVVGVPVNVWHRCERFGKYRRTRVVAGALLSVIAGVGRGRGVAKSQPRYRPTPAPGPETGSRYRDARFLHLHRSTPVLLSAIKHRSSA
jgi:hypothetical protein